MRGVALLTIQEQERELAEHHGAVMSWQANSPQNYFFCSVHVCMCVCVRACVRACVQSVCRDLAGARTLIPNILDHQFCFGVAPQMGGIFEWGDPFRKLRLHDVALLVLPPSALKQSISTIFNHPQNSSDSCCPLGRHLVRTPSLQHPILLPDECGATDS